VRIGIKFFQFKNKKIFFLCSENGLAYKIEFIKSFMELEESKKISYAFLCFKTGENKEYPSPMTPSIWLIDIWPTDIWPTDIWPKEIW
jgi:hypothetical protein